MDAKNFIALAIIFASIPGSMSGNDRPIIGILSQELTPLVSGIFGTHSSYIAASYVKYIEGAGGRVVPIWINKPETYYRDIIGKINGLLFPGGASLFTEPNGYAAAGSILYQLAIELNDQGDYFPVWGTCLGFELITFLSAGQKELRSSCSATNIKLPVEFESDFRNSSLYGKAPDNIIEILRTQNVTAHFHQFCVTKQNLTAFGLKNSWHVLSVNHDLNGQEFISSIESNKYPIYATMFHPEKNGFEWKVTKDIPHTANAIIVMQYFSDFFVNETRKNSHKFPTEEEENAALIYNFNPTFTGDRLSFEQCYFFDEAYYDNNSYFSTVYNFVHKIV